MVRRVVEAEVLYERAALCRDRAAAAQAQQRLRHPAGTAQPFAASSLSTMDGGNLFTLMLMSRRGGVL
jgi:hypothetical protein